MRFLNVIYRFGRKSLCEWVQGRQKLLSFYFSRLNERKKKNVEKIVGPEKQRQS